jgi:plasmid stabilization system protein ParE
MAELIWTEPALHDLDAIADYIALEDPLAARRLVKRVFEHVEQLEAHPESGSRPPELRSSSPRYRQIIEPPCRVFYRHDSGQNKVFVLYIVRGERRFRKTRLIARDHH